MNIILPILMAVCILPGFNKAISAEAQTKELTVGTTYTNGEWTIYHQKFNNGWHLSTIADPGKGTFDFSNNSITQDVSLKLVWESIFTLTANDFSMGKMGYSIEGTPTANISTSKDISIFENYN